MKHWNSNKQKDKWKRPETEETRNPEIHSSIHTSVVHDERVLSNHWRTGGFFDKGCWATGFPLKKDSIRSLPHTLHTNKPLI